jgi:hypothetical protein
MKRARFLLVRARRKLHARPQGDAFELTGTVGLLDHDAGGVVAVFLDDDSRIRTKMQIPKLMTRGERCKQELLGIPSRRIAPEIRVGRTSDGLLAGRAELMRTGVGAVGRRAGSLIACPVEPDRIGVTFIHCARSLAAAGSDTLPCFCSLVVKCLGTNPAAVVPAKAGTHNHYTMLFS